MKFVGPLRRFLCLFSGCLMVEASVAAATLIVSNKNDSGAGSLRQAILDANATNGLDTIIFQIPPIQAPFTISPTAALPPLTDPVIIDGTSQTGYAGQPLIELNGTGAGGNSGLRVLVSGCTIQGLVINRFASHGIDIGGPGGNVIRANYIGTDTSGAVKLPNAGSGISISSITSGNIIGGTNAADRNLISGNGDAGIYLLGSRSNVVQGNYIGCTVTGTGRLGNANSGVICYGAAGNQIGGSGAGARNVISANGSSGINILQPGSDGNLVAGNYVGVDVSGILSLSNVADGITIQTGQGNVVGGSVVGAGNLVSGNGQAGISLAAGATSNSVFGNLVGTDVTGKNALGNNYAGVTLSGSTNNLIGAPTPLGANVISGNKQEGVFISTNTAGTVLQGNFIGLGIGGSNTVGNLLAGVSLAGAFQNLIGGAVAQARNVISGNGLNGISVIAGASGNALQGNYVGVNTAGNAASRNNGYGVVLANAPGNSVLGNVISGNADAGVGLVNAGCSNNAVAGNLIGTDATGSFAVGNLQEGIFVTNATANTVGGALPGAANVVSGNATRGIYLLGSSRNTFLGNVVGLNASASAALPNAFHNFEFDAGSFGNVVGSSQAGSGNVIAYAPGGGPYAGVRIRDGCTNNMISGNSIYNNAGLGIDLGVFGVSANDSCDADGGANQQQNFPVLTQVVTGAGTGVRGTLNSTASSTFTLEFFGSPSCDPTFGYGEGQIFLGQKTVITSNNCNSSFVATLPISLPAGYVVTATATDGTGNTSEFSQCAVSSLVPTLALARTGIGNQQLTLSWTNTATGFVLKQTGSLLPPIQWATVTNTVANSNGLFVVTVPAGTTNRFYALSFE